MTNTTPTRVQRTAHLQWIPISEMRISPQAQRDRNDAKVSFLAAHFDPEEVGAPTVNLRDGHYYVIDGQHRVWAMHEMGWDDQQIQCWTYKGLTEAEEAEKFLKLNNTLTVKSYDKFRVAITAGRDLETDIDRVVRAQGLVISNHAVPGAVSAVDTLRRVYSRADAKTLGRTLRIIRDAYGDAGFSATVIDGIGMLCSRYNGQLDDSVAVQRLGAANGGVNGLLGRATQLHRSMGGSKANAVAGAAVEFVNRGKGGKKLPDWWKAA